MTKYIVDLTNNLINKYRYYKRNPLAPGFIEFVSEDLLIHEVQDWNPDTIAKIAFSLETGDVLANTKELFGSVKFAGNLGDSLRELISLCLAYVIRERLNLHCGSPYVMPFRFPERTT
jgi:hypothetical protein